jgi:hypothetical protein
MRARGIVLGISVVGWTLWGVGALAHLHMGVRIMGLVMAFASLLATIVVAGAGRRVLIARGPFCHACQYDLSRIDAARCPECGEARPRSAALSAAGAE